jgi:signal transduction histidine kinase
VAASDKKIALIELAGTVAHELNNIFTAVAGNLSLLEAEAAPSREPIADVLRAAQRGIVLSSKLQAFAGRQPLRRETIDLNRLVERVVRALPRNDLLGIDVRLALSLRVPVVVTDEAKLAESVHELIANAIAAMPVGGRIDVETQFHSHAAREGRAPETSAVISVADSGMGMSPEIAARAFDPLFTTKPPGAHAGWGLAGCDGFVRQAGGYMTIASKPGEGTRVEIHLPAKQGAMKEVPRDAAGTARDAQSDTRLGVSTQASVNAVLTSAPHHR